MATPTSPTILAESIAGPGRYKFDELVAGIAAEQQRLGARPYATILWQQVIDFEGMTDWLYLGEGFDDTAQASRFIDDQLAELLKLHTKANQTGRHHLKADPDRKGVYLPSAVASQTLRICDERSLTLTADEYNRIYYRAEVLGAFPGPIVGTELFASVGASRHELWSFFVRAGEATSAQRIPPTPFDMVEV